MRNDTSWRLVRAVMTALALFAVWLLFTASLDLFSVAAGAAGSMLIAALTYDLFLASYEANLRYILPRPGSLIIYLFVVVWLLYRSSFVMLAAVIRGSSAPAVNPRIVHFRTRLRSDLARMMLANSITMTPGTITLDLNDDHLTVHWMFSTTSHAKAAGEEVKGLLERFLRKVWA